MSGKEPKNYYKNKWYLKKKNSAKSHTDKFKKSVNNERKNQSLDPTETDNLLSVQNSHRSLNVPYYGWNLYFHCEEYKDDSTTVKKIQATEHFIDRQQHLLPLLSLENLENGVVFTIDIRELYNDEVFMCQWCDFKKDMYEHPLDTLNCLKVAIHQKILETVPEVNVKAVMNAISTVPCVRLKIINYQPIVSLQDVKISSYGKLISTRGCVIRVGRVKHLAQWAIFACSKCNLQKIVKQPQGIYTVPKKCDICGVCKFNIMLDSPHMKSISFQIIRIQELLNDEQENKGRMPRVLDVELMDNLVDTCMPGDDITLIGIMKGTNDTVNTNKTNNTSSFSLYMEAVTILNSKHRAQSKNVMDSEMSIKDYLAIKEVYNTPNIFPLLIHSLCPSIYGHEMIKAGLILSLFGGNSKHSDLRDGIHVLVVGDPGLGKSQMLQACARVAVKGVYICGNSSTSSGLTVTLTKENGSNDFALEPGALVLADRGCCCIDEFDKMSTQHMALLEAMEQQSVSVAKSGTVCSLPARTSILAAANPIGGRYDRSKTIIQNLNMSQPLLSRFDLVFLLLDEPDEELDDLLCQHVMTIHTGSKLIDKKRVNMCHDSEEISNTVQCTLRKILTSSSKRNIDLIPHSILRKYISYARQYVKPKLSEKAAQVLQQYYLELRSRNEGFGGLSVYNRQLEAMIRLTEARAKLELRTEATESDAFDVVEILRYTMTDTLDSNITINFQPSGDGKLTDKKVKEFIRLLRNDKESTFSMHRLNEIAANGRIVINDFSRLISKLNEQGILLKIKNNTFKFISD